MEANLNDMQQRAIWAYNWTSFNPEKRGKQLIEEFNGILLEDLKEIEAASEEQKNAYVSKFRSLFSSWIGAKSNCASSVITGGSGFNVRRAEKANRSEHNKYELFTYWRSKAKNAILKSLEPEKTYSSELDRYRADLANRIKLQEIMKNCNAIIKKAKGKECTSELMAAGLSEKNAIEIQKPSNFGGPGFARFNLTNNLANIKRVEERIQILEAKEQASKNEQPVKYFEGGKVEINYQLDRVLIVHDTKPDSSVISSLKRSGFHWSPRSGAWMRQITPIAIRQAEQVTGVKF